MPADETDVNDLLKDLVRSWPLHAKTVCGKMARLQLQALFLADDKKCPGCFKGIKKDYKRRVMAAPHQKGARRVQVLFWIWCLLEIVPFERYSEDTCSPIHDLMESYI